MEPAKIGILTYLVGEATVVQDIVNAGTLARQYTDVAAAQKEAKIRAALILLGWTPPPEVETK